MKIEELRAKILGVRLNKPELSWAKVHQVVVPDGCRDQVSVALVYRIATEPGYEPKEPEIRDVLGLDQESAVTFVDGKPRPRSSALDVKRCACGRYFVSNHPRRRRCFSCSPFRGKKG